MDFDSLLKAAVDGIPAQPDSKNQGIFVKRLIPDLSSLGVRGFRLNGLTAGFASCDDEALNLLLIRFWDQSTGDELFRRESRMMTLICSLMLGLDFYDEQIGAIWDPGLFSLGVFDESLVPRAFAYEGATGMRIDHALLQDSVNIQYQSFVRGLAVGGDYKLHNGKLLSTYQDYTAPFTL